MSDSQNDPLALVVPKEAVDPTLEALRAAGTYDDERRLVEYDEDRIGIPVIESPREGAVPDDVSGELVRQTDPEYRTRGLEDLLRERGWVDEAIAQVPNSWAVLGTVILISLESAGGADDEGPFTADQEREVGEALLNLHGGADTVLAREGISGETREPSVRVIAGEGDTETVHTEHGIDYGMDLARVMFSPGNKAERKRMGEVVDADERVFDMFAGIGYFTLPMAAAGARVTATEINPEAFRYLLKNAVNNGVQDRIQAYRTDCRDVETTADRVVMGYYDAHEYLDAALDALEPGGVVHLHEAVPDDLLWGRPVGHLEAAASDAVREVEILDRRRIKTHSEGVYHVVLDARVE
ncbi:MAG: tRNA wybutosine-synthesizing protein 2 [Halobacteriales archaeon]|jgi:tRNA wybutosine-synthesizing protein 2